MLSKISAFRQIMQVYGRLRLSRLSLIGALSCTVFFAAVCSALMVSWVWYHLYGEVILPDHEILGEKPDISFLLPLPLIWVAFHVAKGRLLLTADQAVQYKDQWDENQRTAWEANDLYGIASLNIVFGLFGILTLLCLAGAVVGLIGSL